MTTRAERRNRIEFDRARRRVERIPKRMRPLIGQAIRENARDFRRIVRIGAAAVSQRVARSVRAEQVPGSRGLFWRVVSGGQARGVDAFFAHLLDGGTAAGFRRYRRGTARRRRARGQRARGFFHPGTRETGFHRGALRVHRRRYAANMRRAYREGAKLR